MCFLPASAFTVKLATMNPLTNVKNIQKLNQRELELGVIGKKSWHDEYKDSAWIFIGGLPYDLTEGDIVCVFSQYGEIVNINLVRDKSTGKSKGFAFLCYEDQRSTVLAVDNLNSIKLLGRVIRVDHVSDYKKPKETGEEDELTKQLRAEGCAPKVPQAQVMEDLPTLRPSDSAAKAKKSKKDKKDKKKKKKKKKQKMKVTVKVERKSESDTSSSDDDNDDSSDEDQPRQRKRKSPIALTHPDKLKQERHDSGYDRAIHGHKKTAEREGRVEQDRKHSARGDRGNEGHGTGSKDYWEREQHREKHSGRDREERVRDRHSDRVKVERDRDGGADRDGNRGERQGGRRERREEHSDHRHSDRDRDRERDRDGRSYHHLDDRRDKYRDDYDRRQR